MDDKVGKAKRIIFTSHALEMMQERGIATEQVLGVLKDPQVSYPAEWGHRVIVHRSFGNRTLKVVYKAKRQATLVITAAWLGE